MDHKPAIRMLVLTTALASGIAWLKRGGAKKKYDRSHLDSIISNSINMPVDSAEMYTPRECTNIPAYCCQEMDNIWTIGSEYGFYRLVRISLNDAKYASTAARWMGRIPGVGRLFDVDWMTMESIISKHAFLFIAKKGGTPNKIPALLIAI
jgi:hypothetical protein